MLGHADVRGDEGVEANQALNENLRAAFRPTLACLRQFGQGSPSLASLIGRWTSVSFVETCLRPRGAGAGQAIDPARPV